MDKSERPEIAETFDKDIQFMVNLENAMTNARQLLGALQRDWTTMDALTRNETMGRVHVLTTIDLYNRIKALAEPRGYLNDFEWDVAVHVKDAETSPDDPMYHSRIIDLYYQLLARYYFWLDKIGILLQNQPPNLFAESVIEEMEEERERQTVRERALKQLEEEGDVRGPGTTESG